MSLQVWLPLNGNLTQQGLSNIIPVNNGAIVNTEGKLGNCYSFGTETSYLSLPAESMNNFVEASVAFWVKILSWNTNYATLFQAGTSGYAWVNYIFGVLRNSSNSTLCFTIGNGTTTSTTSCQTSTLELNTWYHLAFTYNSDGYYRIYINGILDNEQHTNTIITDFSKITMITIGKSNDNAYQSNCLMNDLRIYDHCLSMKEIKELSKGLVLHYKLDNNGCGPSNLLLNGFGELGTTNWSTPANVFTDDLPSADTSIKAKFRANTSQEYIPIYRNHIYKLSLYIKASATSGYTYPSIRAYDIDKNEIRSQHQSEGFNLNTMTTLTQELKSGDTKIYVADLSNWNANSGTNYNYAAIFGYADSTGYIYPDGTYTRTIPAFGTGTNAKTNLDKINNIINLNSAYSGRTIPVGTSVCAATAGSTYYYPFGSVNVTTITDWTYKEITFSSEVNRLKYAKYIRFYAYTDAYMAGITILDTNLINSIEWDCSGNNYHGEYINPINRVINTNKYEYSTSFDGVTSGIIIKNLFLNNIINNSITYAFWINPNSERGKRSVYFGSYSGTSWSIEKNTSNNLRLFWNGAPDEITTGFSIADNEWQHICITKNNSNDIKVYYNGIEKWSSTRAHNSLTFPTTYRIGRDTRSNDGTPYEGLMSDFRIYATALSADDVLELYHTAASIDKQNNFYVGEIKEV